MNIKCLPGVALCLLLCCGCGVDFIYEKFEKIPDGEWFFDYEVPFEFEITDTIQSYDLYLLVRHTTAYPYQNFWVNINTEFPNKENQQQNVDIPMADKTGKWYGTGFNNIKTNEILIQPNAQMPQTGVYNLKVKQTMRYEPVVDVLDIGFRIEPAE